MISAINQNLIYPGIRESPEYKKALSLPKLILIGKIVIGKTLLSNEGFFFENFTFSLEYIYHCIIYYNQVGEEFP
jgi:hypothetical protein